MSYLPKEKNSKKKKTEFLKHKFIDKLKKSDTASGDFEDFLRQSIPSGARKAIDDYEIDELLELKKLVPFFADEIDKMIKKIREG